MHVRIQLIRDDGSVVMDTTHNARARVEWNATHMPLAQIVVEPGVRLVGFTYEPCVVYSAEELLAKPMVLEWRGETLTYYPPTLASSEGTA